MTSGWHRASYFRRYGRELVSKPAISLAKSSGGYYRRTTSTAIEGKCTINNKGAAPYF